MSNTGASEPVCSMTCWACKDREIGVPPRGTKGLGKLPIVTRKMIKDNPELIGEISLMPGGRDREQR